MSELSALQVIEGWSKILNKMKHLVMPANMGPKFYREGDLMPFYGVSWRLFALNEWSDIQDEKNEAGIFIYNEVWPLFTQVDMQYHGLRFRQTYHWLHEFENPNDQDFPEVFQHFEADPGSLPQILLAYYTLVECEAMKRKLVFILRERNKACGRETQIEVIKKLEDVNDDQKFLQLCMNHEVFSVCDCYRYMLDYTGPDRDTGWRKAVGRIRQFLNLVQPSESTTQSEDLKSHILSLRTTALARPSGRREEALLAEIKQLREKVKKLEENLRGYDRIVSDVSFRHLLEMLPLAEHAATGKKIKLVSQSGPEWQAFWGRAWNAAAKKSSSPLYEIRENSSQVRRDQIEEEGKRLFATLSANIHASEKDYNPIKSQRDFAQGLILDALKPKHIAAGIVDWDREQKRILGLDMDEGDKIGREMTKDNNDEDDKIESEKTTDNNDQGYSKGGEAKNDDIENERDSDPGWNSKKKKEKKKKKK